MNIIRNSGYTEVLVLDGKVKGYNPTHYYAIVGSNPLSEKFATIDFQNGPIQEKGVNGCQNEDIIAIVIHRLEGSQRGPYASVENAEALVHLTAALEILDKRTTERKARGVEGKYIA